MVKKKKRKKNMIKKPKLPPNEAFWLTITKNPEEIKDFAERGSDLQRKSIEAAVKYRLWQIQEGNLKKDFFGDLDVKKIDFNVKLTKRAPRKKKKLYNGDPITKKEKKLHKKVIDLFDFSNIEDLTK